MDLSFSVSRLLRLELIFWLENTSNPPRLAGKRITKAATQINPPPNHAINALHRPTGLVKRSLSNTGKPVVVKAPTISKYESRKLLPGKIIQEGNAKNKGSNTNKRIKEMSCTNPVSFYLLLEEARFINAKTKNPLRLLYKKILASLKASTRNPYTARECRRVAILIFARMMNIANHHLIEKVEEWIFLLH